MRLCYRPFMICRLSGLIESVEGTSVVLRVGEGVCYEVLVPAFMAVGLASRAGERVNFTTLQYMEGQGQGTSFIPRLIGFETTSDRRFFELFTTVKGIGNRKALRAMAAPPAEIARAIASKDTGALKKLPEIGARMAETIVAELSGKVEPYLAAGAAGEFVAPVRSARVSAFSGPAGEAVEVLIALGETREEAERRVGLGLKRAEADGAEPKTSDAVLQFVYSGAGG